MKRKLSLFLFIALFCLFFAGHCNAADTGGKAGSGSVWEDQFNTFNPDNWTTQFSGLRLSEERVPNGVTVRDGVMLLKEPLAGVRLTSRQKFLYGTFEARVRINPADLQYFGFMSRAPWAANNLSFQSEPGDWQTKISRDGKGGYAGIYFKVPKDQWYTVKIVWEPKRAAIYLNDGLVGEITDPAKIPQSPMPIILDVAQPNIAMEFDWIKVTGNTYAGEKVGLPPAPPASSGNTLTLQSRDWKAVVDPNSGIVRKIDNLRPTSQTWTPEGTRAVDLYIKNFPDGDPVQFVRPAGENPPVSQDNVFTCRLTPEKGPYLNSVQAAFSLKVADNQLLLSARLTALSDINQPVEIGLGMPFQPDLWQRQLFPRSPWLLLHPRQENQVRLPFISDPDDVTVASTTGNWNFYPFSILQAKDRSVLWGGMDLGERMVLSPNNFGCVPAVTLAPKSWPKGKTLELEFSVYNFPKSQKDFPGILRWYLSNCTSSDPLTKDLFPVKDWTPRVLPKGGGVAMPDVRITRMNPKADAKYFDAVCEKMLKFNIPNLWITLQTAIDGSQPVSGSWYNIAGLPLSAEPLRVEVERLQNLGLRPCSYTNQFIMPELLKIGKDWVIYDTKGNMITWATYSADNPVGNDWFTKELSDKVGAKAITWAYEDYAIPACRNWYVSQVEGALDYYLPSGVSWDYDWAGMGPYAVYVHGEQKTTLAHGTFRAQADIAAYMRKNHPEMEILVNGSGGEPSQLLANCLLLENSDVMSDVDFLAGKALGSAISSMDYFSDHDRNRWTRQMMLDLARGCSFGAPFWTIMTPPESDYIATWTKFLDFSGRTTALPAIPDEDAVTCTSGQANIVGTVWSDGKKFMAAAFDRRTEGKDEQTTLSLEVPKKSFQGGENWQITRLNRLNVEVPDSPAAEYNWKIEGFKNGRFLLSGPLEPGEMVLLENTK